MKIDRHEAILAALTAKACTTRQLSSVCACNTSQAELRCMELKKAGKVWRAGNGRWSLTTAERATRPDTRIKEPQLTVVYDELRTRSSARSVLALSNATGLAVADVEARLNGLKSQGLVTKTDSGKQWQLTRTTATRDTSPFPPPWWDTPNIGLWG